MTPFRYGQHHRDPAYEFAGASAAGLPDDTQPIAHPRPRPYVPAAPPAPVIAVAVTVGDFPDAADQAAARWHAALTYIRLKTAILENAGHGDRIDTAERARLRGDPIAPRSDVGMIRSEAAALLLGAGAR